MLLPDLSGKVIYFTEDNNEASLFDRSEYGMSRFAGLLQLAGAQLFPLDWRRDIPPDADMVFIGGAQDNLSNAQVGRLWAYLSNGGRVLFIVDPLAVGVRRGIVGMQFSDENGSTRGLFELTWPDMGIRARDDVVIRPDVGDVAMPSELSVPTIEEQGDLVYFGTDRYETSHPILAGVENELWFFGARSVEFDASIQPFQASPLVFAPEGYYGETAYEEYITGGPLPFYSAEDTNPNTLAIAAASENLATGARIVVVGDREFLTNGAGLQTSPPNTTNFLYPDNVIFGLNIVGWLLEAEPSPEAELTFEPPLPTATPTPFLAPTATPLPDTEATEGEANE